jgi:NAD(P)-dependent dehydrogenase (short-subunit alcohol dehydrogenase family)
MQGYELHWATNLLGHFALTQHLLPSLLEQRALHTTLKSLAPLNAHLVSETITCCFAASAGL